MTYDSDISLHIELDLSNPGAADHAQNKIAEPEGGGRVDPRPSIRRVVANRDKERWDGQNTAGPISYLPAAGSQAALTG